MASFEHRVLFQPLQLSKGTSDNKKDYKKKRNALRQNKIVPSLLCFPFRGYDTPKSEVFRASHWIKRLRTLKMRIKDPASETSFFFFSFTPSPLLASPLFLTLLAALMPASDVCGLSTASSRTETRKARPVAKEYCRGKIGHHNARWVE